MINSEIKMNNEEMIQQILKTESKQEPVEEELDDFKIKVEEWFKLDDQIRKLSIAIKERKTMQNALNQSIVTFMFEYEYVELNTQFGMIKAKKKQYISPIKLKEVKNKLLEHGNDELFNNIFNQENREKIEKQSIQRFVPKISMTL